MKNKMKVKFELIRFILYLYFGKLLPYPPNFISYLLTILSYSHTPFSPLEITPVTPYFITSLSFIFPGDLWRTREKFLTSTRRIPNAIVQDWALTKFSIMHHTKSFSIPSDSLYFFEFFLLEVEIYSIYSQ